MKWSAALVFLCLATVLCVGCETRTEAQDGKQAVELFATHQAAIQMVILDLVMPLMDGADTLVALRQLGPDIQVILTSGGFGQQLPAGLDVDGFLPKPFRLDQIEALLSTIEKRQGRRRR